MPCVKNFQILYAFKHYQLFTLICMMMVEVEQVDGNSKNKIITRESHFAI